MARSKRKNVDTLPKYSFHDIRLGDTGHAVAFTQWLLKELGYYNGGIDGIFGQKTLSGARRFQSTHNLTVSGVVDRPMRYALYGEAVDRGILKSMPTPYYVNSWTHQEQTTETSHETTPGTGTTVSPELLQEADTTQAGTKLAPTTPESTNGLPEEYQPEPQTQAKHGIEGPVTGPQTGIAPFAYGDMQGQQPGLGYQSLPGTMAHPMYMGQTGYNPMYYPGSYGMQGETSMTGGSGMTGMSGAAGMPGNQDMTGTSGGTGMTGEVNPQQAGGDTSPMELPYGMTSYWQQQMHQNQLQQSRDWFTPSPYPFMNQPVYRFDLPQPYWTPWTPFAGNTY